MPLSTPPLSQADMPYVGTHGAQLQLVKREVLKPGTKPGIARVKPKHMRLSMRKIAVRSFRLHQSEEDAARAIAEPGITGRTILSTTLLDLLERVEALERVSGILRVA